MVIMHVFNSSFWLIHNFDNNLYYDPLTVNHLFIFIMSRVVDENKVQLDLKKFVTDGVLIEHLFKCPKLGLQIITFKCDLLIMCISNISFLH